MWLALTGVRNKKILSGWTDASLRRRYTQLPGRTKRLPAIIARIRGTPVRACMLAMFCGCLSQPNPVLARGGRARCLHAPRAT